MDGQLEGVIQFGHSLDKRKTITLVSDTPWNGFAEINRMAFSERLPRNSESRALGIAFRMLRQRAPHLQWIVSFADATQCGDGTIYRASGFVLTGIAKNTSIAVFPDGRRIMKLVLTANWKDPKVADLCRDYGLEHRYRSVGEWARKVGLKFIPGFQLRYVYFLDPAARDRLTVPILPFSAIAEAGAGMYRGAPRDKQAMAEHPSAQRRCNADHRAPP